MHAIGAETFGLLEMCESPKTHRPDNAQYFSDVHFVTKLIGAIQSTEMQITILFSYNYSHKTNQQRKFSLIIERNENELFRVYLR